MGLHIYAFIQLCKDSEEVHQKNNPFYTTLLVFGVLCFFEALLFTMFCFEMTRENFEMFWNNQTYIEDLKEVSGRPVSFMTGLYMNLGEDVKWWLVPTLPYIVPNYLEKLFEVKLMNR